MKSKSRTLILNLLVLFIVSACGPELAKRYTKADFGQKLQVTDVANYVTVKTVSLPIPNKPSPKIFDLADHGQQAFITALAQKENDADKFMSKLIMPFENEPNTKDQTKQKISRKLVFSINNKTGIPANRIDSIKLTLVIKEPKKVRFSTWDKIVTNYQIIDIGKITSGKSTSFVFSPEVSIAASTTEKIGSVSYGTTLQEEFGIKDTLVTSGTLTDNEVMIFQKGVPNRDLSGNLIADAELEFKEVEVAILYKFDNLFKKDGSPEGDDRNIKIIEMLGSYPNIKESITANLKYEFVFREVKNEKGQKTFLEGDDEVVFQQGEGKEDDIVVIKRDDSDVQLKTWRISGGNEGKSHLNILFKGKNRSTEILFPTSNDAKTFLEWLKSLKPHYIKENQIRIGRDHAITDSDFNKLEVEFCAYPQ